MQLVDLHAQPEAIVQELDQTIDQAKADNKQISTSRCKIYEILCQIRSTKNHRTGTTVCGTFQCEASDMINAKTLVKDRFWIIEENGQKLGTLQKEDTNGWIFLSKGEKEIFHTQDSLYEKFGQGIFANEHTGARNNVEEPTEWAVHGYPVIKHRTIQCLMYRNNCLSIHQNTQV
jgi:hypothetical protein